MINFEELLSKGSQGRIVMLSYPHDPDYERNEHKEEFGLKLSAHCLFRFLPSIGVIDKKFKDTLLVSNLGDLLRPKQFVRHKYHTLKTLYGLEEILENLKELVEEKIFDQSKDLLFFGSSSETFKLIFEAFAESNLKTHFTKDFSNEQKHIIVFSPFVYMRRHYNDTHIRTESWLLMLLEYIEKMNIKYTTIHLIGPIKSLVVKDEWEVIRKYEKYVKILFMENLDPARLFDFTSALIKDTQSLKFIMFSFNIVDSTYFWGKSFACNNSIFENRITLLLFRLLGKVPNIRALSFYDFNPKIEDYCSGVFYSTLVYEYLNSKLDLFPTCEKF